MPEERHGLRPDDDTVERFGARVTVVDPAALLAAARTGPVELRFDGPFPAPVTDVRLALLPDTADGAPTCRM
ncbi:hypothetical protein NCC78_25250, partial [Micromonospora phytophila]|nr:hypothetical protein [Micromonospora phytophila]